MRGGREDEVGGEKTRIGWRKDEDRVDEKRKDKK